MPLFTSEYVFSDDYPTIEPSLKLDFANARALDPRITFTRASTATYVGRDGLIKTADEDDPRFDHDPETGESLGLLIEESRTNLCVNSTASNSWGTPFQLIQLGTKTEVAPTGEVDAFHWIETTDSTTHLNNGPTVSITSGSNYSISAFFKKISGSISRGYFLQWYKSGGQTVKVTYVPSTDTISTSNSNGASAPTNVSVVTYPNGWYKISFTAALAETSALAIVGVADSNGNSNFTGDLSMFHSFWGLQYEEGPFPTSYIPTSGSTATRAVEYGYTSNMDFYNQSEGSVFSEVSLLDVGNTGGKVIWSFNQVGGFGEGFYMVNENGGARINHILYDNSANQYSREVVSSVSANQFYKIIYSQQTNNVNSAGNGSVGTDDTSATLPTIGRLVIGNNGWGSPSNELNPGNCHIKSFSYYPKRLTNTQLQTLTQ